MQWLMLKYALNSSLSHLRAGHHNDALMWVCRPETIMEGLAHWELKPDRMIRNRLPSV
jgi:hypothetical protein